MVKVLRQTRNGSVRRLALLTQGLYSARPKPSAAAILGVFRRLGMLQLDSINVVARSHELVLLSRLGFFDRAILDTLQCRRRAIFEFWLHEACMVPSSDFPFVKAGRFLRARSIEKKRRRLGLSAEHLTELILTRITCEGPVCARDFEDHERRQRSWWDRKPAKIALELLFDEGRLMIDRRVHFQRVYDLSERVLSTMRVSSRTSLSPGEYTSWASFRALGCLGVATVEDVADYYRLPKDSVREVLGDLQAEGLVVGIDVRGWEKLAFMRKQDVAVLARLERSQREPARTALLSPFDNLIWTRSRTERLFGFHYRLGAYRPVEARGEYGYYVLPLLDRGHLVGRIEPKARRSEGILEVKAASLEPQIRPAAALVRRLATSLRELSAFCGCSEIEIGDCSPSRLRPALKDEVSRLSRR